MTQQKFKIAQLKNLGPSPERWLNSLGIYTRKELAGIGDVEAYRRLKATGVNVSLNMVYAIQRTLMDLPWTDLPQGLREELVWGWISSRPLD